MSQQGVEPWHSAELSEREDQGGVRWRRELLDTRLDAEDDRAAEQPVEEDGQPDRLGRRRQRPLDAKRSQPGGNGDDRDLDDRQPERVVAGRIDADRR